MKQVLQNLRTGQTTLTEVPAPQASPGALLIQTRASLISAGTERMLVEFGKASLLAKAKAQPDKVKQVLEKIKTDGLMPTLEAVFNRLDEPLPLGYCNAGTVLEVGRGVTEFAPGDRVVSNGPHAEFVCVPKNLCAKIPEGISDEQAAFAVLSSIGLQGVRLLAPTLGESFVVYGLGLIGLVCVQLLRASGCRVLGVDISEGRLARARKFGAETINAGAGGNPVAAAGAWTAGKGVDGVLITASAKTDDIVHQSAEMCRKRGRIVLVGIVGLNLRRGDFYDKELTFQVSCSYGPGRYDDAYEQGGQDYPPPFVRWTEQRNFQAILDVMAGGQLRVDEMITHRLPLDQAPSAYEKLSADPSVLGVILRYPQEARRETKIVLPRVNAAPAGKAVVGVIGAGNYSKVVLMPILARLGATVAYVADLDGAAARHAAGKCGALSAVTDYQLVLQDPKVNAVLIVVGPGLHARFVREVLEAGKHAFVEKPLAVSVEQLQQVVETARRHPQQMVMAGFNRRFSPLTLKLKQLVAARGEPLAMSMTINAGAIPGKHWVHDPLRGGGRIISEGCHFIDLLSFLCGSKVTTVAATRMGKDVPVTEDKMSISLGFQDGSVGSVNYFANGSKAYPKELLEVFSEGRVVRLDNFRRLDGYGFKGFKKLKLWRQDKGHDAEFAGVIDRVANGGEPLIPMEELVNITLASIAAVTSSVEHRTIVLQDEYGALFDKGTTS